MINYELIDRFLERIFPLPENFGLKLTDEEDSEPVYFSDFEDAVYKTDISASVYFGMSKIVITSPNLGDVVIKIPFNGYFSDSFEWHPFVWATGSDAADYCLAEYEKYNKLKTYGLNCFVAKTIYYKTIDGIRIFLQEKVTPENDIYKTKKPSKKSRDIASKWYEEGKFDINPEWIATCLDRYGKSKVKRFLYYCANLDLDILEDAHGGNFGYREDGTPALLDFSNFLD